ncbi:hypothetical protein ABFB09_03750 [Dehalogenimonas sp. THU2]|uniref:hypothetical protein n=1 Tax=Dehalogenimonas sp. THU2 TaxID=3151121 RepID=UPI0032183884
MAIFSLTIGIISLIGMFAAFLPYLGFLHWFAVPLAMVGFFMGLASLAQHKKRGISITGMILCGFVIVIGTIKLAGFPDIFV